MKKLARETKLKFIDSNTKRQQRKDSYRKEKLKELQEEKERRMQKFVEGRESLFSQSHYLEFMNNLRKYYLKKYLEDGKDITLEMIMDINDRFKVRDFHLNANLKQEDIKKMFSMIMSREVHSSTSCSKRNYSNRYSTSTMIRTNSQPVITIKEQTKR